MNNIIKEIKFQIKIFKINIMFWILNKEINYLDRMINDFYSNYDENKHDPHMGLINVYINTAFSSYLRIYEKRNQFKKE